MSNYTSTFANGASVDAALNAVTSHKANHKNGGIDAIKLDEFAAPTDNTNLNASTAAHGLCPKGSGTGSKVLSDNIEWIDLTEASVVFGTTAGTACEGNDSRLSDDRDPNSHATSHKEGGTDYLRLDELAAATSTARNATTSNPGLCPAGSGTGTKVLSDNIEWIDIPGGSGITLSGSSSTFYNGLGVFSVPNASGSIFKPAIYIGRTGSGADYECDGVNDNVQFNAALTAATSGTTIYILQGTYNCTERIYQASKNFDIIGIGRVIINFTVEAGDNNGITLTGGSAVTTQLLSANAAAGDLTVTLASASSVQAGDLIKIYNNVAWQYYASAGQVTGEIYEVKSVSGNVVTLTERLLRAYTTAAASTAEIRRPIEVHIQNLRIIQSDPTDVHEGITIRSGKNCTVSNCYTKNCGLSGISFYHSYNCKAYNNDIHDGIKSGSGYGVGVWSGSAFIDIFNNHIENCRHCVTINTDETVSLTRKTTVHHNTLIGASITTSNVVDAHPVAIDMYIHHNKIYPKSGFYGAWLGSVDYTFENNEVYGGGAMVVSRGTIVGDGIRVIKNNKYWADSTGALYKNEYEDNGSSTNVGKRLEITKNIQYGGQYGYFLGTSYKQYHEHVIISDNEFYNLSARAISISLPRSGGSLTIDNNLIDTCAQTGIYLDGVSYTPGILSVQNNKIFNPNTGNGGTNGISLTNITKALVANNYIYDANGNAGGGINAGTGCDYNVFLGNVARGMTGTKFSFGTGSNNTDANNIPLS